MMKKLLKSLLLLSFIPMALTSCSNEEKPTTSEIKETEAQEKLEEMKDYVLSSDATYTGSINDKKELSGKGVIKYKNKDTLTGQFKNNKPDGEMVYTIYESGDTFKGTGEFLENYLFSFLEGKYSYARNKRTYEGKFKNNLFDDDNAVFSFGTGTSYHGPFREGSNIGQIGTMYYPPSVMKGEGVWWIKGKMIALGKVQGNTIVKGFIRFNDRSTYEGDIYFDGGSGYFRLGDGVQDFTECNYTGDIVGGPKNEYLHKYVGKFDYRISQWIYGNGVMYFTDVNQTPTSYLPGFYTATKLLKNYDGKEDDIVLLEGYNKSMKCEYHPQQGRVDSYLSKYGKKQAKILFAGDSYLDMWQREYNITSYEEDMKGYDCVNVGIGGTIWEEWNYLRENLVLPYCSDQIVFHLGFNDLHMGATPKEAFASAKKMIEGIRKEKPTIRFYLLSVEPSPAFSSYLSSEKELNKLYKEYADSDTNIHFINSASLFMNGESTISDLSSYFISDMVHMNKKGYDRWVKLIKESIDA